MSVDPSITELQERLREFAAARDWERFHNRKDLAVSVAIEAAELLEVFQWKSAEEVEDHLQSSVGRAALEDELADVFIYLLRLADVAGVDLAAATNDKISRNEARFPAGAGQPDEPTTRCE